MSHQAQIPVGFSFAAGYAGIRKKEADDLALFVSDVPASAAAVFTRNAVQAAPVTLSRKHLANSSGWARAIVCNAGNANCAVPGMTRAAKKTARGVSKLAAAPKEHVLIASTGVIGEPLPAEKLLNALPGLYESLSPKNFEQAARAIMTTDTVPKMAFAEVETPAGPVRIAGVAKGSGMIQPDMATMLAFLFTDAGIRSGPLQKMLVRAVDDTFNAVTVDSDTSTNDTVFLLANGVSGIQIEAKEDRAAFEKALAKVCEELAAAIARDGEGARKLLTIYVDGARNGRDARRIAREIANSPLVKTALAGADPNWGRVLAAAGKSGVDFDPSRAAVSINGFVVCENGVRTEFDEPEVQRSMEAPESVLRFHLRGKGKGEARFWTCDFTEDYIKINAEYRT